MLYRGNDKGQDGDDVTVGAKAGDLVILNPAVDLIEGSKARVTPQKAGSPKT